MEFLPEERIRRKAFVHYDVQSVGINFMEAATKRQNSTKQGILRLNVWIKTMQIILLWAMCSIALSIILFLL